MKIATEILGGIVIVLLMIAIIFTFVGAKSVVNKGADIAEGEENGVSGLLALFAALGIAYVGTVVFYLMLLFGVLEILYMLLFGFGYYRLYSGTIPVDINKWNGVISGVVFFFSIFVFAFSPKATWGFFVITLLLATCGITYSILTSKLHTKSLAVDGGYEFEDDETPVFVMDEE